MSQSRPHVVEDGEVNDVDRPEDCIEFWVRRAQGGDRAAFSRLVRLTHADACGAARTVLRDPVGIEDVLQESYLKAFRGLSSLETPSAFRAWLKRIVRREALGRVRNRPRLPLIGDVEPSGSTSDAEWRALDAAMLRLNPHDRQMFERFYLGRWSTSRIAEAAGLKGATVRKRLERIRLHLRKVIDMEQPTSLPERIVELLARPLLTDLPENPVGAVWQEFRSALPDFTEVELPERVDLAELGRLLGVSAEQATPYRTFATSSEGPAHEVLRADLTAPLLLKMRGQTGTPKVIAHGRCYRPVELDAVHMEAFHQAEFLSVGIHQNPWSVMAWIGPLLNKMNHGAGIRIEPHNFPPVTQAAWEIWLRHDGRWLEVGAWGVFREEITRALGFDPRETSLLGGGFGLERLAALRYGIDDIRKISAMRL